MKAKTEFPILFSKTATGAINTWEVWTEGCVVHTRWGQQGGALQTASFGCVAKNEGRANATTPEQQAVLEAESQWKKQQKKKGYSTSVDGAQDSKKMKPLLAQKFEDHKHKLVYPATVQPKFNGLRCLAYRKDGKVFLQSRGNDPIIVHHVMAELEPLLDNSTVLDGEMYCHGTSLQTLNSWIRRPQEDSGQLTYNVYDFVSLAQPDWTWSHRLAARQQWFAFYQRNLLMVRQCEEYTASDEAEVMHHHARFVAGGYEGGIVRSYNGLYRWGYRSPDLLKVKAFQDEEFVIVGYTTGKGKFANVPIFTCKTKKDVEFEVTPNGTEAERAELLRTADSLIGKLMTVKFFDWTADGKPFNPTGLQIRDPGDLS